MADIDNASIDRLFNELNKDAKISGYTLNPDIEFTKDLVKGLLMNQGRFGYPACPCRRATGKKTEDLDIICPCDYRDPDLNDHGMCFCGLYVSQKVMKGEVKMHSIPERRPEKEKRPIANAQGDKSVVLNGVKDLPYPVWRCKVCGYLCARKDPPEICPICKVTKDRFERFI